MLGLTLPEWTFIVQFVGVAGIFLLGGYVNRLGNILQRLLEQRGKGGMNAGV